jgi:hypothetical protein
MERQVRSRASTQQASCKYYLREAIAAVHPGPPRRVSLSWLPKRKATERGPKDYPEKRKELELGAGAWYCWVQTPGTLADRKPLGRKPGQKMSERPTQLPPSLCMGAQQMPDPLGSAKESPHTFPLSEAAPTTLGAPCSAHRPGACA